MIAIFDGAEETGEGRLPRAILAVDEIESAEGRQIGSRREIAENKGRRLLSRRLWCAITHNPRRLLASGFGHMFFWRRP